MIGWLERMLAGWTAADIRDHRRLLGITDEYAVRESEIAADDWVAGRELRELHLPGGDPRVGRAPPRWDVPRCAGWQHQT